MTATAPERYILGSDQMVRYHQRLVGISLGKDLGRPDRTKPRFMFHEKEKQRYGSTPAVGNASVRYSPFSPVSLPGASLAPTVDCCSTRPLIRINEPNRWESQQIVKPQSNHLSNPPMKRPRTADQVRGHQKLLRRRAFRTAHSKETHNAAWMITGRRTTTTRATPIAVPASHLAATTHALGSAARDTPPPTSSKTSATTG